MTTGAASEQFMHETARFLNLWTNDTPLKIIALKSVHIMPVLFLQ